MKSLRATSWGLLESHERENERTREQEERGEGSRGWDVFARYPMALAAYFAFGHDDKINEWDRWGNATGKPSEKQPNN